MQNPVTPLGPRRSQRVINQPERTLSGLAVRPQAVAPAPSYSNPLNKASSAPHYNLASTSAGGGNPVPSYTQALSTSYGSRLRTGSTLLMQPMSSVTHSATTSAMAAIAAMGPTPRRRGGVVNYAEGGSDDDFGGDSDDDDDTAKNASKRSTPRLGNASSGRVGSPAAGPAADAKQELDKSYLGLVPPSKFFTSKPMTYRVRHDYPSAAELARIAETKEVLIPIRIDLDTDTHRIRDAFLWNVNEEFITPESFAKIFCADLELAPYPYVEQVAGAIRAQVEEHSGVATFELESSDTEEVGETEEAEMEDDDVPEIPPPSATAKSVSFAVRPTNGRLDELRRSKSRSKSRTGTPVSRREDSEMATEAPTFAVDSDAPTPGADIIDVDNDDDIEEAAEEDEAEEEDEEIEVDHEPYDARVLLALDVQINKLHLLDTIEWDLSPVQLVSQKNLPLPAHLIPSYPAATESPIQSSWDPSNPTHQPQEDDEFSFMNPLPVLPGSSVLPSTPQDLARTICADLGLSGEALPLITHALHAEILKHKKDAIEQGVLAPLPSVSEMSARAKARNPYGNGPKPLRGVWRDWIEVGEFGPRLEVLSTEEMERREAERERIARRLRRDTSKYVKSANPGRSRKR